MHKIIYLLLFMASALNAQEKMSAIEANSLKMKVKEQANFTKTISSDFTQYKHLDFLSNDIITSGKLAFKAPNLVKWEYVEPFKYSVLFKDETLYINDEGNKSNFDVGSSKMFKQLNKLIINSIKGDMFDDNEFDIEFYKKNTESEVHFISKNKEFSKFIKAFQIIFNSKGEVVEVKMIEPSDDYTKIVFNSKIVNKTLPDAIFTD